MADLELTPFSVSAIRALNMAVAVARGAEATALSVEHLLMALLNQRDGNARLLLEHHFEIDVHGLRVALERFIASVRALPASETALVGDDGSRFPLAPATVTTLVRARAIADSLSRAWAGTDHLLAAMLEVESPAGSMLRRFGVTATAMREALELVGRNGGAAPAGAGRTPPAVDLVRAYQAGTELAMLERPEYLGRIVNALAQEGREGVLLVGEPGVGKRSLVRALAQALARETNLSPPASGYPPSPSREGESPAGSASHDSPSPRRGGGRGERSAPPTPSPQPAVAPWLPRAVWALRPAALLDGVEAGIRSALALAAGGALLVPDIHLYFGGSTAAGWAEAGVHLRRALVNGDPHVIGTTTPAAFAKWIEPDPALTERFAVIRVDPATVDQTVAILDLRREPLQRAYGLTIAPAAPRAAASFARTYLPQPLPAAGVELLESACALVRAATAEGVPLRPAGVAPDGTVDEADLAVAVHQQTGIPIGQMLGPERERLARMEEIMHERVVDQDEAIRAVSNAVRRSRAGLKDPKRPIGSFIFLGPSGVGKTEVARALAEFLFGGEEALIQIDMSEYMEKHAVSRLIGAPPGYVGFEEGGQLTEKVRARPYAVVLFDEIEKAHPDVFNLFLQLLEEGWLTDGRGRRVDFRNTVIIMTSNIGTEFILTGLPNGPGAVADGSLPEPVREAVLESLRARFRPEFLNRVDATVLFKPLGPAELRQILDLFIKSLGKQLAAGPNVRLEVTDAARAWLLARYDQPEYGARPLRRLVDRYLKDELGTRLIDGSIAPGQLVRVDADGEALTLTPIPCPAA